MLHIVRILLREKADEKASQYGLKSCSVDEILANPDIDIIFKSYHTRSAW